MDFTLHLFLTILLFRFVTLFIHYELCILLATQVYFSLPMILMFLDLTLCISQSFSFSFCYFFAVVFVMDFTHFCVKLVRYVNWGILSAIGLVLC